MKTFYFGILNLGSMVVCTLQTTIPHHGIHDLHLAFEYPERARPGINEAATPIL